ncbi:MAG: type VI immunity family protein [Sandaracinaceae bacterium]
MSVLHPFEPDRTLDREPVLLPGRVYLRDRPEITIARPTLGLALYTDAPTEWAMEHAARIAERFVELVGVTRFRCFMTSQLSRWRTADEESIPGLLRDLRAGHVLNQARHLFTFRLADEACAPRYELTYREVNERRSNRLGYLRLTLPHDHPADDLLALALEISQTAPIWTGIGGFMLSGNPLYRQETYTWGLAWARRCWGLHLAELEDYARLGRDLLPGTGWLNVLGQPALDALGLDLDRVDEATPASVAVMRLQRGALIRAGAAPVLGDANLMNAPTDLAALARALEPHLPVEAPPFPEPFGELATPWLHRFAHPEAWT